MKLLITGATGFIGRNLVAQFSRQYDVFAPNRSDVDLLEEDQVTAYLQRHRFDVVIHSATVRADRKLGSAENLLRNNCRMYFNLARHHGLFGRMLWLSSGAVYDRDRMGPRVSEDAFDAHVPSDDYGFSKYICAKHVPVTPNVHELRLFGVFGPYENWEVRFISNACCRAVWDLPVVIHQNVLFDYLDVADLGRMIEWFLRNSPAQRHYNVCSGRTWDLKSLADAVVAVSGKGLDIIIKHDGWGSEYSGSNLRLIREMGDFVFTDINTSVAALYQWYSDHRTEIDPALLHYDS